MRKGIDTTDLLVYGHEAWIVTDKSVYEPGEEVCGILRWGHHMRPDGFFRLDEFRAFVTDERGNRIALSPVKGPGDEQGDYYELRFTPTSAGIHTIMAIYDNNYVRDENDVYYEGDRRTFPDILDAKNYPQIYETCISVGEKSGRIDFIHESRVSFIPDPWQSDTDVLKLTLIHDRFPVKGSLRHRRPLRRGKLFRALPQHRSERKDLFQHREERYLYGCDPQASRGGDRRDLRQQGDRLYFYLCQKIIETDCGQPLSKAIRPPLSG